MQNTSYLTEDIKENKDMLLVAMLKIANIPIEKVENNQRLFDAEASLNREIKQLKKMLSPEFEKVNQPQD